MRRMPLLILLILAGLTLAGLAGCRDTGGVVLTLDSADGPRPVVLLLGGSEGGQIAPDQPLPEALHNAGFAVARLGYFGMPGTPRHLQRIALEPILATLDTLAQDSRIDSRCLFVAGVSKGAELALILASRDMRIGAVAALVPAHVTFQSSRITLLRRSSWTLDGADLPFVPYPVGLSAWRGWWQGGAWRALHDLALANTNAVAAAETAVERAAGPVLLVSARKDQVWPSTPMAEAIVARVAAAGQGPHVSHVVLEHDHFVLRNPLLVPTVVPFLTAAAQARGCLPAVMR